MGARGRVVRRDREIRIVCAAVAEPRRKIGSIRVTRARKVAPVALHSIQKSEFGWRHRLLQRPLRPPIAEHVDQLVRVGRHGLARPGLFELVNPRKTGCPAGENGTATKRHISCQLGSCIAEERIRRTCITFRKVVFQCPLCLIAKKFYAEGAKLVRRLIDREFLRIIADNDGIIAPYPVQQSLCRLLPKQMPIQDWVSNMLLGRLGLESLPALYQLPRRKLPQLCDGTKLLADLLGMGSREGDHPAPESVTALKYGSIEKTPCAFGCDQPRDRDTAR